MTTYDITNDIFINLGSNYLSSAMGNRRGESGHGVYYTQMDDMLYTIGNDGKSINVYNLQSLSYETLDTTIPIAVGNGTAITSSSVPRPRLYITGGDSLNVLQIYDIESGKWLQNVPSMLNERRNHGTIVVDGILYVIGGEKSSSIEAIDIGDIEGMY